MKKELSDEYCRGFRQYLNFVRSTPAGALTSEDRIEHQFECLRDWSLFYSIEEIGSWFEAQRNACSMTITNIPLRETEGWIIDEKTGNIYNKSGEFFVIHGIRVAQTVSREVGAKGWCQPILAQIGYDGGLLGLLRKRFNGVPHYLVEAKAEPGNYDKLQLSPTLQATFSNLKQAHLGNKPRFSEYFECPAENQGSVLYDAWLSEDGGRLHLKRNRGMLVEVPASRQIVVPDCFVWLSMYQIKKLLHRNAWVNPHIRGIIAHL